MQKQKERNDLEYIYTWGLFCCLETIEYFINELRKEKSVVRERKRRLGELKVLLTNWKAKTNSKYSLQYALQAKESISELGTLIMEVIMFISAVPLEQIDWFSLELTKLQKQCIKRQEQLTDSKN